MKKHITTDLIRISGLIIKFFWQILSDCDTDRTVNGWIDIKNLTNTSTTSRISSEKEWLITCLPSDTISASVDIKLVCTSILQVKTSSTSTTASPTS